MLNVGALSFSPLGKASPSAWALRMDSGFCWAGITFTGQHPATAREARRNRYGPVTRSATATPLRARRWGSSELWNHITYWPVAGQRSTLGRSMRHPRAIGLAGSSTTVRASPSSFQ